MGVLSRLTRALVGIGLVIASAVPAFAGTTGTIKGTVIDAKTKEPISAATVIIDGTKRGGICDANGVYQIPFVQAGTYNLIARATGHRAVSKTAVTILADFTNTVNFSLDPEAVEAQTVIVSGERPVIEKSATSTVRYVTGKDIQNKPTRGYQQVASLQSGVVQRRGATNESTNEPSLFIRGGRANEVAYYVDGFSQQDPLTGISTTSINNNAIDQVVVMAGGFSAEYGRAMSGAVNVITREGSSKYKGAFEALTDNLSGNWISANKSDNNIYSASIGGPVVPGKENITFYASGERRWLRDRNPRPISDDLAATLSGMGLRSDILPSNSLSGWTWQGKVSARVNDKTNLKLGTLGSQDDWQEYFHTYLFDYKHAPRTADRNQSAFATLNQQVGTRTFHTLALNYSSTSRKRGDGIYFDNVAAYARPNSNPRYRSSLPYFWPADTLAAGDSLDAYGQVVGNNTAHVFDSFTRRESAYMGGRYDINTNIAKRHQVKFGGDFQYHSLRQYEAIRPTTFTTDANGRKPIVDVNQYGYDNLATTHVDTGLNGVKHPITASAYLQDKYEASGVVANVGLRYDYLAARTEQLLDEAFPLGPNGDQSITANLTKSKAFNRLSPRLGVAFPVTDRTVFHLNWGRFYQQPDLQNLYVNYDFLQYKVQRGGYFYPFGNPNLKPENTTAYEAGFVQQLSDISRIDVSVYYKDIKDLVEVATITSHPSSFSSFRNRDYGTAKGLDLQYSLRPARHVGADISYSLSFANGTGSLSTTQRNIAWTSSQPPKQTAPLDFDQRHKISASLDLRNGKGEGLAIGKMHPLENAGLNVLFSAGSGSPFTPSNVYDEVSLAASFTVPTGPINSRYIPWTSTMDVKANKDFKLASQSFSAYVWVTNVFDRKNPVSVYTSSGDAASTNWLETPAGKAYLSAQGDYGRDLYLLAEHNPNQYDGPRRVRFGIRGDF